MGVDKATIPSARSPAKMASGGLKSAKNVDNTQKFTFLPIKESIDQALLEEIEHLKQVNSEQEKKYSELLGEVKQDNFEL